MSVSSEEDEENDSLGHKTDRKVLKAPKNKNRAELVAVSSIEEAVEDIPTDNEGAIDPTPITRGLKRSYAMLDVLDMTGDDDPTDTEFEASESEQAESTSAGIVELDDNDDNETPKKETPKKKAVKPWVRKASSTEIIELDDEDETPKKKKKVSKPSVREAIKAKGGQLGQVRFVDSLLDLKV